jgi:hypothetical protein
VVYVAALLTSVQVEAPASYRSVCVPAINLVVPSSFIRSTAPMQVAPNEVMGVSAGLGAPFIPLNDGTTPEQLVKTPRMFGSASGV